MKLNYDCVREVLKYVESQPLDAEITFKDLVSSLDGHTKDDLYYACIKLDEAGFLTVHTIKTLSSARPSIHRIRDISFMGHEFLANIKEDSVWSEVKDTAKKVGLSSLAVLGKIAAEVAVGKVKTYFSS